MRLRSQNTLAGCSGIGKNKGIACGNSLGHEWPQRVTKGFAAQMNACGIWATDNTYQHGLRLLWPRKGWPRKDTKRHEKKHLFRRSLVLRAQREVLAFSPPSTLSFRRRRKPILHQLPLESSNHHSLLNTHYSPFLLPSSSTIFFMISLGIYISVTCSGLMAGSGRYQLYFEKVFFRVSSLKS